jgi:hypothetical protein
MHLGKLGLVLIFIMLLAACGGETADSSTPEIEGPALVMFYTDN